LFSVRHDATFTSATVNAAELEMRRAVSDVLATVALPKSKAECMGMNAKECVDQNYSHCFKWDSCRFDLVQSYYQNGKNWWFQAVDLLPRQHFGIIPSPRRFQRVKV
jgi:hypothetical protein